MAAEQRKRALASASADSVREIFRTSFHTLVKAIEPVHLDVSNKLYADGWISKPAHEAATGESSEHAATRIVKEVETQLK